MHLRADLATLAELSHTPGELGGYGPVIADIVRQLGLELVDGEWTFQVNDPDGEVVATGTTSRRPKTAQVRRARADYPKCIFPGCRQPARSSDLDHREEYSAGGETHNRNLAPLCRHHHMVRHNTDWKLERLANGDHQWTSPLGHTYIRKKGPPD